jgi:uncharacterized membrane protein YgcG
MPKFTSLLLALTLTTVTSAAFAQNDDPQSGQMSNPPMQSQPAPIERNGDNPNDYNTSPAKLTPGQLLTVGRGSASAIAAPGVFVRIGRGSSLRAVTLTNENTVLKLERGIANISVHSAIKHAQILIILPGGETNLIKDGFYTFNANTNTVRTLKGEAWGYPGTNTQAKPIKIKENHAVIYSGPDIRSFEFDPFEARTDLIPYGQGMGYPAPSPGYYGPYAGYPYYDYGYPYYWGYYYPFYFGWGWGWGGGYYGGYRGGWGGGWHGGGGGGGGWGGGGGHGGGGGGHH